jgi:hypothetical protein
MINWMLTSGGDNSGDQNLGRAAYYLGQQLRERKFQLNDIGNYIRTSFSLTVEGGDAVNALFTIHANNVVVERH